ncbi:MAG: MMPL family transporter, partial [Lapillicoccus sp.]
MTRGTQARGVRWVALLMVLAWLAVGGIGGPLVGRLSEVQTNDNANFLPASAESTAVNQFVQRTTDTQTLPYLLVVEKTSGLTAGDLQAVQAYVASIPKLTLAEDPSRTVGEFLETPPQTAIPSQDQQAVLIPVAFVADKAEDTIAGDSALYAVAQALRAAGTSALAPSGMAFHVTGPGGFFADFITAFGGIDGILLLVALGVVFVILLIVYRSPILPIAVLITALFGLSAAALVIFPLAKNGSISLSGQSQGILSILVVGA